MSGTKLLIGGVVLAGLAVAAVLWGGDILALFRDPDRLAGVIAGVGVWGPIAIILLRGAACLMAVVPSSPVLLAAGAAYGYAWGTAYVLIGAMAGAIVAFVIGRWLGRDFVDRRGWTAALQKTRIGHWLLGAEQSQGRMMLAVLVARLTPLVNLDAMGYVAGVTPLSLWRFAIATFAGLVPYTILLVSLGRELTSGSSTTILLIGAAVVLLVGAPLLYRLLRGRKAEAAAPAAALPGAPRPREAR